VSDTMSIIATALHADELRLDQASRNAANAATPGYRRSSVVAIGFDQALNQAQQAAPESGDALPLAPPVLQRITDFSQGSLMQTGRTLDVAIEGKGFMAMTDGHRTFLTRTASLRVAPTGELVGVKGLRLVGAQGDIRPGNVDGLSIAPNGQISRGEQVLGQISLVTPSEQSELDSNDGVLFEAGDQNLTPATDDSIVRSGFLEGSNTNHLKEMLSVMESVRHFESLIRLAQGYDEVMGKAIQKLGEV
jgi:flagellar basal-body rod protein FlgF